MAAETYFLRTSRLGFRHWTPEDVPLALSLWGDPEVVRLVESGGAYSEEKVRERLKKEAANLSAHGVQYWPIFQLADDDFAGCCGLRPYQLEENVYELGFHLRTAHWGKGYAEEAARGAAAYGFQTIGASALFAGHNPENVRSKRVLEKLGFRYLRHRFYPPTGLMHPCYLLDRKDFEASGP